MTVTIRMYRNILGDCFLLTSEREGKRHVTLIDCGVLQNVADGTVMCQRLPPAVVEAIGAENFVGVTDGNRQIAAVAADVIDTIKRENGGVIDVLVVTHEHYDHLSGFALARSLWEDPSLRVAQLWLAWTEDPEDEVARSLAPGMAAARRAVQRAALAAALLGAAGDRDEMAAVVGLADFLGPPDDPLLAVGAGIPSTAQTLAFLKSKAGAGGIRYWKPGDVIEPDPAGAGLRAYVLGPPRDLERLRKDSPSAGAGREVYLVDADHAAAVEMATVRALRMDGLAASPPAQVPTRELAEGIENQPFSRLRRRSYRFDAATRGRAVADESRERQAVRALYEDSAHDRLRIDDEWMASAESLALKLDSDTNNTSLVLAFELPGADRRLLLFAGDAQVGNWLSWGDRSYPAGPPDLERPPRQQPIKELLGRTVFYKVGHHGSHNATLQDNGLEQMTHPDLTAAIPVVETVAKVQGKGKKEPGRGWQMPYPKMYARLEQLTRKRIVRGDGDPAMEQAAFRATAGPGAPAVRHHDGGLWVEIVFPEAD